MSFKLLVAGPRNYTDEMRVYTILLDMYFGNFLPPNLTLITGGAKGVDTYAMNWAKQQNIPFETFKPDYKKYEDNPKYAPLARNEEMAKLCSAAIVFWSGVDGGTLYTMRKLAENLKPFQVISIPITK
jgi:predicted Rossmann fold nucleotide-binding protein DprA/Smf involved in DNA uptake